MTYASPIRYVPFQHGFHATNKTWPSNNVPFGRVISAALPTGALTGPGTKLILHSIRGLVGVTGSLELYHGDGTTTWFAGAGTLPAAIFGVAAYTVFDWYLDDGLAIGGGTAGSWEITYHFLR